MRSVVSLLLIVLILCSLVEAQEPDVERWREVDVNEDGVLTIDEVPAPLRTFFNQVDLDSNGQLNERELKAAARRVERMQEGSRDSRPVKIPDGVIVRKDQVYREGHERWKLDVYLPEGEAPEGGRPGLVFVHGGGWRSGSKNGGQWAALPASYAEKGYVCISVNYRLTGDGGGFPECVHDVKNAVRWLRANADELGLDSDRIGAFGNSAGAHLVSLLGLVKPEAGLEGDGTHLDQSSLVQAVCASATPSDFLSWKGEPFPNRGLLEGDETTFKERAAAASPISYASADAPRFLLIHAEDDKRVPFRQGQVLVKALKDAGAESVEWLAFETGGHGVFGGRKAETYPAMEAFFAKALNHQDE